MNRQERRSKKRPVRPLTRTVETLELPKVDTQCKFFGGHTRPQDNYICPRPGKFREYNIIFCDLHYTAMGMDPKDWTDEMMGY